VALASQMVIFPIMGIQVKFYEHIILTIYFTLISVLRSYCVRRYFNRRHK
jgi:hypothetical protein